jgi:multicomponent Na+:H+ antiporter subunit D
MPLKPIPWNMYLGMGIASFLCLFIGLFPQTLYSLLPFPTDYVPYTPWHVLQASLLLGFTGLGFYFMRNVLHPKPRRNLDFDALYRVVAMGFYRLISVPLAFLDSIWNDVYEKIGLKGLWESAKATIVFDTRGIDGVLDGSARGVRGFGGVPGRLQTGRLQDYLTGVAALGLAIFALVWALW